MLLTTSSTSAGEQSGQGSCWFAGLLANTASLPHCAQLTCKLPQWVALLELPGKLSIFSDFLAHVSQHHSGVHGVYPDLGPEATASGTAK